MQGPQGPNPAASARPSAGRARHRRRGGRRAPRRRRAPRTPWSARPATVVASLAGRPRAPPHARPRHWGRALGALGTFAATTSDEDVREAALEGARRGMRLRSPAWHAMAYAALGGCEVLGVRPGDSVALGLLTDARTRLGSAPANPAWPWPEARLSYANAVLPEALVGIGAALGDERLGEH